MVHELNNFRYLEKNTELPVGEARSELIKIASGEFLCFLDDDVEPTLDYLQKCEQILKFYENVDVFGGPDQTRSDASEFQLVLGEVMKTFLAMGPTTKRHSANKKEDFKANEISLILCNLWIRKEIFDLGFDFPKGYVRNEENILLGQLERAGKKMIYSSDLYVYHERKNKLKKLVKATFYSGAYRTYGFFDETKTIKWHFLVPQIALLTFLLTPLVNINVFLLFFAIYLMTVFYFSIRSAIRAKAPHKFYLAVAFYFVYNFVYAFGMFYGYYKALKDKYFD